MDNILAGIKRPTLVLDEFQTRKNIEAMAGKAACSGARFRPHFKTHQSAKIGSWFRDVGLEAITVSSVDMATYFVTHGWRDITVAFPVNIRQMDALNELAGQVTLNLLVESSETVEQIASGLRSEANLWLKIDTGYGRTGIPWNAEGLLKEVAKSVRRTDILCLAGLLSHAGHTYRAGSPAFIVELFDESRDRMVRARARLGEGYQSLELSVGDTPGCSLAPSFEGLDEVRPGNFVFYDLAQLTFGSCAEEKISVALACPVVAKHPSRQQIVIHGGAVHLSLDRITVEGGLTVFGGVALPHARRWTRMFKSSYVRSLSQEHGVVQAEAALFEQVEIGDLLMIIPVHSCLTANLMGTYLTLDGERIEMAPKVTRAS